MRVKLRRKFLALALRQLLSDLYRERIGKPEKDRCRLLEVKIGFGNVAVVLDILAKS